MQSSILASSRVSKAGSLKELEEGPCGLESKSETGGEGEGRARSCKVFKARLGRLVLKKMTEEKCTA